MTAPQRLLVVNAGSSSLKLRWLDGHDRLVARQDLALPGGHVDEVAVARAVAGEPPPDAIGHRLVHGGQRFHGPVQLDPAVERELLDLVALAPLHQPLALEALAAISACYPGVPAVACFDTAFHATLPPAAATYALPRAWRERWALRRYGFHGLSHAYATRRAGELLGRAPVGFRAVTCHLGAGASLAAVAQGRSVDTTMGFTPLDGLVMATRAGSVDPGLLLWLQQTGSVRVDELAEALERGSGLLGLAGTADMALVIAQSAAGHEASGLALAVYLHSLRAGIAAMAAAMGGLDVLVFTGGVGEHAPGLRAMAADGLRFLGVELDPAANAAATGGEPDRPIDSAGAAVRCLVIEAREDLEIARGVRDVLAATAG